MNQIKQQKWILLAFIVVGVFSVGFQIHAQSAVIDATVQTEVQSHADGDPDRPIITGEAEDDKEKSSTPGERVMQPEYGTDSGKSTGAATTTLDDEKVSDDEDEKETVQHNQTDLEFLRERSISVKAVEVRGWDPKQKETFLAEVKTYAEVQSGEDLENFAKGVLLKDSNVASIVLAEESTQVVYSIPVKFLGVFNTSLNAQVDVNAEGRVKVKYPWLGFLFKKLVSVSELGSEIEKTLPEVGDEVIVGFEHQAQRLVSISNVLKTKHDTAKNSVQNVR